MNIKFVINKSYMNSYVLHGLKPLNNPDKIYIKIFVWNNKFTFLI